MSELYQWIDIAGGVHALSGGADGADVLRGVTGHLMPPIRRTDDIVPLQPGSRKRSVFHDASEQSLLLAFRATTETALRALIRTWLQRLNPENGDGILRYTGPDGTTRDLHCGYISGLEGDESENSRWPGQQNAVVTFKASDPYWADSTDSTQIWTTGAAQTFFPFFPLRLGASEAFGTSTLVNLGDVATYPSWVIAGPVAGFTLSNLTTGRVLEWDGSLGGGEFLVVDCRPGNQSQLPKSVFKNDGTNVFGSLSQWDFWPFEPGGQTVEVEMAGAGGGSQVTAVWRNRYLSA